MYKDHLNSGLFFPLDIIHGAFSSSLLPTLELSCWSGIVLVYIIIIIFIAAHVSKYLCAKPTLKLLWNSGDELDLLWPYKREDI